MQLILFPHILATTEKVATGNKYLTCFFIRGLSWEISQINLFNKIAMIANNISTERLLFGLIKTEAFETYVFFFSPLWSIFKVWEMKNISEVVY